MWGTIAKWAVRVALWAVKHPDEISVIVNTVKKEKK